jgi:hypothetical protein
LNRIQVRRTVERRAIDVRRFVHFRIVCIRIVVAVNGRIVSASGWRNGFGLVRTL